MVAGGVDEAGVVLSSVGGFDVANGTWQEMPDMAEVSSSHQGKIPFLGRMTKNIKVLIMKTELRLITYVLPNFGQVAFCLQLQPVWIRSEL